MKQKRIGIIMHGVTGRMGMNQHLIRSVKAIRDQGGLALRDGTMLVPDIHIVGRNADKIEALARAHGVTRWSTDLDAALADPDDEIFFDAASTALRPVLLEKAIAAGKHVYSEKPVAEGLEDAVKIARLVKASGVKSGIVHDKLSLPGLIKLKRLVDSGFFGRILSIKGEFGYWVFEGDWMEAQRPSWNYRAADGGGMVSDMLPHWRYVLDNIFAPVTSVICTTATHIPERWDETGTRYDATADDAAYATFMLEGGVVAHINSSWCTRVRRDDLVTLKGELKLRNYEKREVEIVITNAVPGKPLSADEGGHTVADPNKLKLAERRGTVFWRIKLKPGEEKTLRYQYERYVQSH